MFCGETEPGEFLLSVEVAGLGLPGSGPEETAKALCEFIEELTDTAREAWVSAYDRVFDIGFDAVFGASVCGQPLLTPETMQRMSCLNARLALSIYTN
jgi:hypothetical protein